MGVVFFVNAKKDLKTLNKPIEKPGNLRFCAKHAADYMDAVNFSISGGSAILSRGEVIMAYDVDTDKMAILPSEMCAKESVCVK